VKFLTVYIEEAHAQDEWPIGKTISVCKQAKTIEQRSEMAKTLERKLCEIQNGGQEVMEIVLDTMNNDFEKQFAAWPFRFYAIQDNRVVFKPQPKLDPYFAYNVEGLKSWMVDNGWL